jgi:hypothetical protein
LIGQRWVSCSQFRSTNALTPSQQAELADQAIDAHQVYVTEVRHPVDVGSDQEAHLVAWLSKRLGQKLVATDLAKQGFELVGSRLLPDGSYHASPLGRSRQQGTLAAPNLFPLRNYPA